MDPLVLERPLLPDTMIIQHMAALNAKRIVLASGSPRRRDILTTLGKLASAAVHESDRSTACSCSQVYSDTGGLCVGCFVADISSTTWFDAFLSVHT